METAHSDHVRLGHIDHRKLWLYFNFLFFFISYAY